jgi:hypothetical protein
MRLPVIQGVIARRILANYRVDADVLARFLPPPFRPKLIRGFGIAGICLIGLRQIKPRMIRGKFGFSSENAAHRIAVEWTEGKTIREGVFIPRRDSSSRINALVGGRLFPGFHHHAAFQVVEQGDFVRVALESDDHLTQVWVEGQVVSSLPSSSVFHSLREASAFFEAGSVGYSVTPMPGQYDGLELRTYDWKVEPLAVDRITSSFFEDEGVFPPGSICFDCALLMRGIRHEWHSQKSLCIDLAA